MFKFQPTTSEGLKAIIVSREGKDAATTFILPQLDKKELLSMLQNKLEGNDWQKTMHADDAITALITMAPDDGEWKEAGNFIQIMSVVVLGSFIISPFSSIPHIFNQQKKAFILEIIATFTRTLPFIIGAYLFKLEIEKVLLIYSILYGLILLYSFCWSYSLVKLHYYREVNR